MATHSSTLAWKIPWTEEPGRLHGVSESWMRLSNFTFTFHPITQNFTFSICPVKMQTPEYM